MFVCAKCNCVDNTALGLYWSKRSTDIFKWNTELKPYMGKALCSECAPVEYDSGRLTGYGKWHGKFPKISYEEFSTSDEGKNYVLDSKTGYLDYVSKPK